MSPPTIEANFFLPLLPVIGFTTNNLHILIVPRWSQIHIVNTLTRCGGPLVVTDCIFYVLYAGVAATQSSSNQLL